MSHSQSAAGHDLPTDPAIAATIRAGPLRTALDAVGALVDECRLEFHDEGIRIRAADPAAVALVSLSLDAAAFESYVAAGELVGVDIERLTAVVGMATKDQSVRLLLDAEARRLHVVVDELSYTLGLIDPATVREPPELDENAFETPARAMLPGSEVDRFVGAAAMVADHLTLGVDPETPALYVDAEGDTDRVSLRLGEADLHEIDAGEAHSLYSLGYLREMTRPIPGEAAVELHLGEELPVRIGFDVADGGGSVEYLLSPRLVRT